jgi:peptidyl-prolyl cis-trans isomerase SurA
MVRPDSSTAADTLAARQLADSLRTLLGQGADFADLARRFSDDTRSAPRGGALGTLSPSQQVAPAFKEAAFALDEPGDVSGVVETRFGFHLIQLQGRETLPTFEEAEADLKQLAGRLPRTDSLRQQLARTTRQQAGVSVDTTALLGVAGGLGLDSLARALIVPGRRPATARQPIATLGDSTLTLGQLSRFVTDTQGAARRPLGDVLTDFLDEKALDYAAATLEARDPAFRATITEYRDGLLLFSFMQDSVWSVAAQDTAALRARFAADRAAGHPTYRFPERVRLARLTAATAAPLDTLAALLRQGTPADSVMARARAREDVIVDTSVVARSEDLAQSEGLARSEDLMPAGAPDGDDAVWQLEDGEAYGPTEDAARPLLLVRLETLPARPKTFEEALSTLARDQQDAYEAAVIERLRARYEAAMYPERLEAAFAAERDASDDVAGASPRADR